jgi:hypothetical protein
VAPGVGPEFKPQYCKKKKKSEIQAKHLQMWVFIYKEKQYFHFTNKKEF